MFRASKMVFKEGGDQIVSFLKKMSATIWSWLANEENFWVFALDGLILNCFVWNRRLK